MAKNIGLQCVKNGDFYEMAISENAVIGNTLYQNQAFILRAEKGDFVENPEVGVGITSILNAEDFLEQKREIIEQFKQEGLSINKLKLDNKGLTIDANYK